MNFTPPAHQLSGFNCPLCGAFAHQYWEHTFVLTPNAHQVPGLETSRCAKCQTDAIWLDGRMIYPDFGAAPLPNQDLSADVLRDYEEARSILSRSPRGAAALLRLAIQKLCKELGEPGKNLNNDIGALVRKGLPAQVQQALDAVRVIGNDAVHPGQIDVSDNPEIAGTCRSMDLT